MAFVDLTARVPHGLIIIGIARAGARPVMLSLRRIQLVRVKALCSSKEQRRAPSLLTLQFNKKVVNNAISKKERK